jgi:uncharacterized protein (DUF1501 family)
MKDLVLLRGMSTGDGNHRAATYLMHTGFRKGVGGVTHPSLGAMAAADLGKPNAELPNFVAVGNTLGPGYLGPRYAPLIVNDFANGIPSLRPFTDRAETDARTSLLEELDRAFMEDYQAPAIQAHATAYERALALMHSNKTKAFNLNDEPASVREAYGKSKFGQGCLLARRLIEEGVPFVEVTLGGWDTHKDADKRVKVLSEQLDPAMAALLAGLKQRGLLATTLVLCLGEFGRSPKDGSRHYARAWTAVLGGGGLRTGQVIGGTGRSGADVEKQPLSCPDFMAAVCRAIGIDYTKDYTTRSGRPMHKVDKKARPVPGLLA